jgi:hypothetical protein
MRDSDRRECFALTWRGQDTPERLAMECLSLSRYGATIHTADGEPQAALGLVPLWPGVFSAWMFATNRWAEVWRATVRHARLVMTPAAVRDGLHRAQAFTAADHISAHRFLEALGFGRESVPVRLGRDREAFVLYGWEKA